MADAFAFVLHGHLPYARASGRWPHGEEWVHEAILGTYLPLASVLFDLRAARVPFRLTIGLTPVLLEQLADADIIERFDEYATDQQRRAEEDVRRWSELGEYAYETLAARYVDHFTRVLRAFRKTFSRDLVGALADLVRTGHVEMLTSGATHGYLPLLRRPSAIRAQLTNGVASTRRHMRIDPEGIWLPECAYAPGLERALEDAGLSHFVVDAALLEGRATRRAALRSLAARRGQAWASGDELISDAGPEWATPETDVLAPFLVGGSRVAVLARHPRVSGQVWSAQHGYPGDPVYREFHRKDEISGLRYWRVTDSTSGLGDKQIYDWDAAFDRTETHAEHFVSLARAELEAHRGATGRDGLLVVAFDLELFGHWWFEGVVWLAAALKRFAAAGTATSTLVERLRASPPTRSTELREGSWGKYNDHSTWLNERTASMWPELDRAASIMESLARRESGDGLVRRATAQAMRELLIAQASDWEFLITTGQAAEYARERFRTSLLRFERCVEIARAGVDDGDLDELESLDNPFPDVDWSPYGKAVAGVR